ARTGTGPRPIQLGACGPCETRRERRPFKRDRRSRTRRSIELAKCVQPDAARTRPPLLVGIRVVCAMVLVTVLRSPPVPARSPGQDLPPAPLKGPFAP